MGTASREGRRTMRGRATRYVDQFAYAYLSTTYLVGSRHRHRITPPHIKPLPLLCLYARCWHRQNRCILFERSFLSHNALLGITYVHLYIFKASTMAQQYGQQKSKRASEHVSVLFSHTKPLPFPFLSHQSI